MCPEAPPPASARSEPTRLPPLDVVIDDRERASGFANALLGRWPEARVGRLEVGDVDVGERVVVERKTVRDAVASLQDGRYWRQVRALAASAVRPLLLVEGEEAWDVMGVNPEALRGVLLGTTVGFRVPLLRTAGMEESALTVARIAEHEHRRLARVLGSAGRSSSRQAMDVLASIPGVGRGRAERLLQRFGSIASIGSATERELREVASIGRLIARTIARVLSGGRARAAPQDPARPPPASDVPSPPAARPSAAPTPTRAAVACALSKVREECRGWRAAARSPAPRTPRTARGGLPAAFFPLTPPHRSSTQSAFSFTTFTIRRNIE